MPSCGPFDLYFFVLALCLFLLFIFRVNRGD